MKHVFIINPAAGKNSPAEALVPQIEAVFRERGEEPEFYRTTGVGDATRFAKERCEATPEEQLRLYSCGGDGTMNEILQGLYGHKNAALGVIPCGSGNDFVRSFPGIDFTDLRRQAEAPVHPIDLLHFNGTYSANICSAGLDSDVCRLVGSYKKLPLVTGSGAYVMALVRVLFDHLGKKAHIVLDDGRVFDEEILLLALANGGYYGGGWLGSPRYDMEDGLIEFTIVRKIPRLTIARVIGPYKKGEHLDSPALKDIVIYTRCRSAHITFDQPTTLNADGQVTESATVDIEILPKALPLIYPAPPQPAPMEP